MLYEKLTSYDIDAFRSYVQTYGPSSDASIYGQMADTYHILRVWDKAKSKYLYEAFGEKFILEREVEFAAPRFKIRNELNQSLEYGDMSIFKNVFRTAILEAFEAYCDEYYFLMRLFDRDNLLDNVARTLPNNTSITFPTGETIKLSNTAKTVKLLGKISKILNLEKEFEVFRLKHSLILNQKKIKGTLCLSIHPLDYLTMSDNNNGWTSCMSWEEDGDYRMGTVEMMNSPCVVVAYLKSNDKKLTWYDYKWNSKLWRTLIVVDPSIIVSVKNYPYENIDAINLCLEWLRELTEKNLQWLFPHPIGRVRERENFEYDGQKRLLICNTHRMYNDFGCCDHYGILSDFFGEEQEITYSGETECMWCGNLHSSDFYGEANYVFCENCSDGGSQQICCDECCEYYSEDEIYWVEGSPLCPNCCDEYAIYCDICGEYVFQDHSKEIYLARVNDEPNPLYDYYITVADEYALQTCHYSSSSWLSVYFTVAPHYSEEKGKYYWNIEDLTETGLHQYFGLRTNERIQQYREEAAEYK